MSVELLVNVTPPKPGRSVETGLLQEVHVERQAKRGIVGNIYKARSAGYCPACKRHSSISAWTKRRFSMPPTSAAHRVCGGEREGAVPGR